MVVYVFIASIVVFLEQVLRKRNETAAYGRTVHAVYAFARIFM